MTTKTRKRLAKKPHVQLTLLPPTDVPLAENNPKPAPGPNPKPKPPPATPWPGPRPAAMARALAIVAFTACCCCGSAAWATPPPEPPPPRQVRERPHGRRTFRQLRDLRIEIAVERRHRVRDRFQGRAAGGAQQPRTGADIDALAPHQVPPTERGFRALLLRLRTRRADVHVDAARDRPRRLRRPRRRRESQTDDGPPPDELAPIAPRFQPPRP